MMETRTRSPFVGTATDEIGRHWSIGDDLSVVLVGTYPPTECGIATHTANLRCALSGARMHADVIRIVGATEDPGPLHREVAALWRCGPDGDARGALAAVGRYDAVVLQHEFGIYPGRDGDHVVDFVESCPRPVLVVLHTVLDHPSFRQRWIIDALAERSAALVVQTEAARRRLVTVHDVDPDRTAVIPHGAAPNLHGRPLVESDEPIALTWGLLGPGKGIEHGIDAIARMRRDGVDVRYLIAGQTHPNVRASHGERYRDELKALAGDLGVADLVDFDDRYRDWNSLHALVRSAAVVLVPYDSLDQVTSGVLVEALAAGKPVVSTAFPHAVELEPSGALLVVEHESPGQIASALSRIVHEPELRELMSAAARREAERYDWSAVAQEFRSLITEAGRQRARSTVRAAS